ncbi:uncharacterized protein [Asterias amurensis]|uniref:uncharacterized protein n=1 Tax=Asterias amurensis TaxID=7602 RepID=UPI003AB14E79
MYSEHCCPLLVQSPRNEHIIPILCCLHCLPIKDPVVSKPWLLTYKSQHDLAPACISELKNSYKPPRLRSSSKCLLQAPHRVSELTTSYTPPRCLRSSSQCLLQAPQINSLLRNMGVNASPTLWNSFPLIVHQATSVNSFNSRLKTQLFLK